MLNLKSTIVLIVFFSTVLGSILLSSSLYAQDSLRENSITKQIWLDYNPSFKINDRVAFYSDIGARTMFPGKWNRYVLRPSVRYQMRKLFFEKLYYKEELHAGIGFFFTDNTDSENRLEIRPFQGYRLAWPDRPRIRIQHYVRLEERFDIETKNWVNTFGLRFRYQAEMVLFLKGDWFSFNKGFYVPVSLELFWNLIGTKQFNDVVRIIPGIGYEFSSKWKGELHIGYFYTRNTVEDVFGTNDLVLRIRVYYKFEKN